MTRKETPRAPRVADDIGELAALMMGWIALSMKRARTMEGMRLAVELGLTMPQTVALHICAFEEDVTLTELVSRLSLSPSAVSSLVQRMVELGLVTRSEGTRDRRQKVVRATPHGQDVIERMTRARFADMRASFEPLTAKTRGALKEVLSRMIDESARASGMSALCPTEDETDDDARARARTPTTRARTRGAPREPAPRAKKSAQKRKSA